MNISKKILVSGLFLFGLTSNASAYLKICNKSSQPSVKVAVAKVYDRKYISVIGWYPIKKGRCYVVSDDKMNKANFLYYYAKGSNGMVWQGKSRKAFCTLPENFSWSQGTRYCPGSIYKFKRMRIKAKVKNYTLNLTTPRRRTTVPSTRSNTVRDHRTTTVRDHRKRP